MTAQTAPNVVVLAGPNGAGKSTSAPRLLPSLVGIRHFVNADAIASGLSAFAPESVAITAGRLMLERLHELAAGGESFALETTLSGRSLARFLKDLTGLGYRVHIIYLWLDSVELSLQRVAERVRRGGHNIPANVIRRRHRASLRNFMLLYAPLAASWRFFDNSGSRPLMVAYHLDDGLEVVVRPEVWDRVQQEIFGNDH